MRISDWSSDVCSSDLRNARFGGFGLFRSVLEYTLRSKGPLTHSAHEVGGFVKTRPGLDRPDAQIGMGLYSIGPDEKGAIAIDPYPGMTILGYFTRPESQGDRKSTRLNSSH